MHIHWEESATTKTAPFRRNPLGAGGAGRRLCRSSVTMKRHRSAPHFAPATRSLLRVTLETFATGC
jgi:hypothetical protein